MPLRTAALPVTSRSPVRFLSRSWLAALLLSAGCLSTAHAGDVDDFVFGNGFEPCLTYFPDADGDGFGDADAEGIESCVVFPDLVDNALDCNDFLSAVNPDAPEICANALDDNCDGVQDDVDADRDGVIAEACYGDDADDGDPTIGLLATEQCFDDLDNDANGLIDLNDPACNDGCDGDLDGFPGTICGGLDLDDTNDTVFPGANERCGDFLDNDQDGAVDEACVNDGIAFGPDGVVMASGDVRQFVTVDSEPRILDWIYSVDGTAGGNAAVGTIEPLPVNSSIARYTAPDVGSRTTFTLRASDADDGSLTDTATVTVVPAIASATRVVPFDPVIGLAVRQRFEAQLDDPGGALPLRAVFWKVNGVPNGSREFGTITDDGVYLAPDTMPGPLPVAVSVGFSFSRDGPLIATTPVTLARLDVTPRLFESNTAGPAGQFTAEILTSDDRRFNVLPGTLAIATEDRSIAQGDANGQVIVGTETGTTFLNITDPLSGASDSVQVNSLPQVSLTVDAIPLLDEWFRVEHDELGGTTEIEFTRPNTQFQFRPRLRFLRGSRAGEELSGLTSEHVTIDADGANILAYGPGGPVPQPSGVVGVVSRVSGIVDIGDVSGTGTITATYDDGLVQETHTVEVMFTRPDLSLTVQGTDSRNTETIFNTEYIDVTLDLTNGVTGFVGKTPILFEVMNEAEEVLRIGYKLDAANGTAAQLFGTFEQPPISTEGNEVALDVPSTLMRDLSGFRLPARIGLRVVPGMEGVHTIRATIANDPSVTMSKQVTVTRGDFAFDQCQISGVSGSDSGGSRLSFDYLGERYERVADTPVLIDSWVPLELDGNRFAFGGSALAREPEGPIEWRYTEDGIEILSFPGRRERLRSAPFGDPPVIGIPGDLEVTAGPEDKLALHTAPFPFKSVIPESVSDFEVLPRTASVGTVIPRSWQLGSIEIVSVEGSWTDLEPLTVVLQTYDIDGNPRTVGYEKYRLVDGGPERETISELVYGVFIRDTTQSGPFLTGGTSGVHLPVDDSGRIELELLPKVSDSYRDDPERFAFELTRPLVLKITPYLGGSSGVYTTLPEIEAGPGPDDLLPRFTENHNSTFEGYLRPCIWIAGNGLVTEPPVVPIPSQRVRDAVKTADLPARAADTVFTLFAPGQGFADGVASGVNVGGSDFGEGIAIDGTTGLGDGRLEVTATLDLDAPTGERDITLAFNDGSTWAGTLRVVQRWFEKSANRTDENLPLNARPEGQRQAGVLFLEGNTLGGLDLDVAVLELVPSLAPAGGKGASMFRGATVDQPLVGFSRQTSPETGEPTVSRTEVRYFGRFGVRIFGNSSDLRTLSGQQLGSTLNPDGLPDFVSGAPDAELFQAKVLGNWADYQRFTAYNVVAAEESIEPPTLDFDTLKAEPLLDVYSTYGSTSPMVGTWEDAEDELDDPIGILVDREARSFGALDGENQHLNGIVPGSYWGGILDQYYLLESPNNYTRQPRNSIGKDGRVGAFDGEFGPPTGGAVTFGIELDGVFYENDLFGTQVDPNSAELRDIPVVDPFGVSGELTEFGLMPDAGGTSGGILGFMAPDAPIGGHAVVSRTPGQRAPGLAGGYLIQDTPDDLEFLGLTEDDIFNVAIYRGYQPSQFDVFGGPITKDFDRGVRRRLMTYSTEFDRKAPIETAARVLHEFSITTDPPGLPPVRVKAAIDVRELEGSVEGTRLYATTQSDGDEAQQKVFLDTVTDLAVEAIGGVILSAISGGGYLELCGQDVIGQVVGEAMDIASGTVSLSFDGDGYLAEGAGIQPDGSENYRKTWVFAYDALQGGVDVPGTSGTGIKVSLGGVTSKLLEASFESEGSGRKYVGLDRAKIMGIGKSMAVCALVRAPITATKKAIKDYTSIERLGGKGAAGALGIKSIAVSIPMSDQLPEGGDPEGVYNFFYNYQRKVEVRPKEEGVRLQSDFEQFDLDPATVSDRELVLRLLAAEDSANENRAEEAILMMRRLGTGGVRRLVPGGSAYEDEYQDYTLRTGAMHTLQLFIVPDQELASGNRAGDFAFTTDTSVIPVATLTGAVVSRSNPNATARAYVTMGQLRMLLRGGVVLRE